MAIRTKTANDTATEFAIFEIVLYFFLAKENRTVKLKS